MITILHTEASKGWGGQEIRIIQEALGLKKRGYGIIILAEKDSKIFIKSRELGLESYPISFSKYNPVSYFKLKSLIEKLKVQIVNTHSSKDSWITAISAQLINKRPKIIRTRHLSTQINRVFFNRLLYDVLPDLVITTGENIRKRMITENKFNPEKIISIPTGVDLERFNPERFPQLIKRDEFSVGTIGVLRSWKGHSYLIDAVPMVIKKIPNVKFYIVGEGPQRENLNSQIKRLKLEKSVVITGHREDIPEILSQLDIVIHPSYANEGIPQAVLQAFAMKKAVIATNIDCINEIVINQKTGILIEPKNADQIAESIIILFKNKNLRLTLGENGRKLVEEGYSYDKMLDKLENVYQRLLNKEN